MSERYDDATVERLAEYMLDYYDHDPALRWADAVDEDRNHWRRQASRLLRILPAAQPAPSVPPGAEVAQVLAGLLRTVSAGRLEYATNAPEHAAEILRTEANAYENAARIVEGDEHMVRALLPSWRWPERQDGTGARSAGGGGCEYCDMWHRCTPGGRCRNCGCEGCEPAAAEPTSELLPVAPSSAATDDPATDPVGTVRVFPRWQDEHHERQYAIRWLKPIDRDELRPWLLLDSEGPQRLDNDAVRDCERIGVSQAVAELNAEEAAATPTPAAPGVAELLELCARRLEFAPDTGISCDEIVRLLAPGGADGTEAGT